MNITQHIREIGKDIGISYDYIAQMRGDKDTTYIKVAVHRGTYKNHVDANGKKWVLYSSLPESTRAKLPSVEAFITALEAERKYRLYEGIVLGLLEPVSREDRERVDSFRVVNRIVNEESGEEFLLSETDLPDEEKARVRRVSQFIKLLASEQIKDMKWREGVHGDFRKLSTMQEAILRVMSYELGFIRDINEKIALTYWLRVISKYKNEGILSLVSKKYGNDNAQKLTWEGLQFLISAMSAANKPSVEMVASAYRTVYKELSEQQVRNIVNHPAIRPAWYMARHGFEAFKREYGYTMIRFKPKFADGLWCSDGTKVNYYYLRNGKLAANLTVYMVIDVSTEYILGWSVCEGSENAEDIRKAVKMSFESSGGRMPYQWQYDNASANLHFFKDLDSLHFPAMPHNGQSKMIENVFKRFQMQLMRRRYNYTGQNIQSKSDDSKVNIDSILEMLKNNKPLAGSAVTDRAAVATVFPKSIAEVVEWIKEDVNIWNCTIAKNGKSRKYNYEHSERPERRVLGEDDMRDMFWVWNKTTITYRGYGLRKTLNYKEYYYEVLDQKGKVDMDFFHRKHVGQEFWLKYDPDNMAKVALYVQDEAKRMRFVAYAMEKQVMPMAIEDYKEGDREAINERLEAKKAQKTAMQKVVSDAKSAVNVNVDKIMEKAWYRYLDREELQKMGSKLDKEAQYYAESEGIEEIDLEDIAVERNPDVYKNFKEKYKHLYIK